MRLTRVLSIGKIYCTEEKNGKFFPINGDFFDIKEISDKPLEKIDRILSPVSPSKVIALGLNYRLHITELSHDLPKEPVIFIKPDTAVIGPGEFIVRPKMSERVDFEAELAFVIKKDCKCVKESEAEDYILGYTCLNDVTARDLQKVDGQWTRAKGFDTFCPIGPSIVTDIDVKNLEIKSVLNGEIKQQGNTKDMIFSIPFTLSFISRIMTLRRGDVVTTGTPSGIGPMKEGDIIEINIENIGSLLNSVKNE
jgi:2-keto-4-pentenoate hydratase/2-oxohepta-3-ene-1,7-dioic acid hydratase in catechol pathway